MISMITYALLALLAGLAIFCAIGAIRAVDRLMNQREAWKYRSRIAELAYHIESEDSGASPALRSFAGWVADFVFRSDIFDAIMRRLYAGKKPPEAKDFDAQFPESERHVVHELVDLLSAVCMLNDL